VKLTLKQLKQLIHEQVEEYGMKEVRRAPQSAGIPIHLYAHKNDDGSVSYHIESNYIHINKDIPGGKDFDVYSSMDKESILEWVSKQLDNMKNELK